MGRNKKILTLVIIHKRQKVLLGLKKRGFGSGRWNGFGGKVRVGETVTKAAGRELLEEAGIKPKMLKKMGILNFRFEGKPLIHRVHVFKSTGFSGKPAESEEMKPRWFPQNRLPYAKMWPDDAVWMPLFLKNRRFKGTFLLNGAGAILRHSISLGQFINGR